MKKVLIFGASGYGLDALYSLDDMQFEMLAFLDNNKEIQGKRFHGYYVDAPENINNYKFDYVILSIPQYADNMRKQLKNVVGGGCL